MQPTAIPGFQSEQRAKPRRISTAQHQGQTAEDYVALETAATTFRATFLDEGEATSFWMTWLDSQQKNCAPST